MTVFETIPKEYEFETFREFYLIRHQFKLWFMTLTNPHYKQAIKWYIGSRWRMINPNRQDLFYFNDIVIKYIAEDTTDEEITNIYEHNGGKSWDGGIYI